MDTNDPHWFHSGARTPAGQLGWTFDAPLVLTALPAGHRPGYYSVQTSLYIRTAAGAGNVNAPVLAWTEPVVGAATLTFGNVSATATGLVFTVARNILSTGVGAITVTYTPASITGSPVGNIVASAYLIAGPLT